MSQSPELAGGEGFTFVATTARAAHALPHPGPAQVVVERLAGVLTAAARWLRSPVPGIRADVPRPEPDKGNRGRLPKRGFDYGFNPIATWPPPVQYETSTRTPDTVATTIAATAGIEEPVYLMAFNAASLKSNKSGMIEVRLEGRQPTTVMHHAASLSDVVDDATTS